ncbi:MAG: S-(hydroxymethyl)glutathione dehydrogenase / alcohol dehydrogenase [Frankiaceae bacterium]|jgi:S-(hydroxymethyl)glutathione dehydrogenase/alcohol dehydrogenase|nr:S-(hydroxymethyl)glutathione dehydrogenase / alcohol dehydrogenase [Frankiaceae bacterium]
MTRAAVLTSTGTPLTIEEIDLAPTGADQVRVRLHATGVCHSDLSIVTGALGHPLPAVPGHEGAGVVTEVGAGVTSVRPGDHVILNWTPSCGACWFCAKGEPYLCDRAGADAVNAPYASLGGTRLTPVLGSAAFAEETLVLERAVVPIPAGVAFEVAALVGCAVTTGFGAAVNTARVQPGDTVVVIGCGGVGLSIVEGAKYAGATTVVAVDVTDDKRALAADLGATHTVDGTAADVERQVRDLTGGRGADHAFEAIGRSATIRTAYRVTRRGGNTVVVGAGRHDDLVSFSALELFFQARSLIGCVYGSADVARDFPKILGLYADGALDLDRLITKRIALDHVNDALAAMAAGEGARTVIVFE